MQNHTNVQKNQDTICNAWSISCLMCGIVGYIGNKNAKNIVIDGLKALEYRGYDSTGIALASNKHIQVFKSIGRVYELESTLPDIFSHIGIGHTRWATHGKICTQNAHPHLSFDGKIAIVHNGVVENYNELKQEVVSHGITLKSTTDSEIIAHLLALDDSDNMLGKIANVAKRLKGSSAFIAISSVEDAIFAYKCGASLVIGLGDGENIVASDTLAISPYTTSVISLLDGEYAKITKNEVCVFKDGIPLEKTPFTIKKTTPKQCDCYMQAEIDEIPLAITKTKACVEAQSDNEIRNMILDAKHIYLCGCGTAYHACLYGKAVFEKLLDIPCECVVASEFDEIKFVDNHCLGIFISQSGETLDTLLALKSMQTKGAKTLAITSVTPSAISQHANKSIVLDIGAEIAVAATKSYVCQLYALYLLATHIACKNQISIDELHRHILALQKQNVYADDIKNANVFFIGKGIDYITAKEGALKLKEITYKSADAYQAGELKHGTIALIDHNSVVIAIVTQPQNKSRIQASISELRSRGAKVIAISSVEDVGANSTLSLPKTNDDLIYPLLSILPLQRLSLATSLALNLNPDKPRNLAKSVTVI